jgi:hypothetical protein
MAKTVHGGGHAVLLGFAALTALVIYLRHSTILDTKP